MRSSPRAQLVVIALVQVLAMALWFSMSAVVPAVRAEWGITAVSAGWLTTAVQIGFIVGAVGSGLLNLADRIPPHRLLGGSTLLGAGINAAVAAGSDTVGSAVALRFLTGVALAGVYPVGMKLMTTWFDRGRPLALGILVGALAMGSAMPHLVQGLTALPWRPVVLASSLLAVLGAAVCLALVRPGPIRAASPPLRLSGVSQIFRDRRQLLINAGYLGHMWELYALWTWLPLFLTASIRARHPGAEAPLLVGVLAFAAVGVAGAAGCIGGGWLATRRGPLPVARAAMLASACCCLLSTVFFGASPIVLTPFVLLWGAAVIADSSQFSTALSQAADPRYVGTALTIQTALGFAITLVTIHLVPVLVTHVGWRFALALLAVGPLLGTAAISRLTTTTSSRPRVPAR